jgi:hypothetical protein
VTKEVTMHPSITATLAADHADELRREAAQQRLVASVRKHRAPRHASGAALRSPSTLRQA